MPDDFLIARNPDSASTLPYLVRIPLGEQGIVLKSKDTWPRTSKVYCHRAEAWPDDADVVERVATRVCVRRGAASELVLDRTRESRSQFVLTDVKGREAIFWLSARTAKQARPGVRLPKARAAGAVAPGEEPGPLEIVVDARERYAWRFTHQQVSTRKQRLDAGDYAVELDGQIVAAVERKSLEDLTSTLLDGRLRYALAELSGIPRAAVVVEDRYSRVFGLAHVRPATVADAIAECLARYPSVPIILRRHGPSPRSGPTGSSPPPRARSRPSTPPSRGSPSCLRPGRCRPHHPAQRPCAPGPSPPACQSATAAGFDRRSGMPIGRGSDRRSLHFRCCTHRCVT